MNILGNYFEWLNLAWKFASLSSGSLRFFSTDISQGSVATRFRRGGIINYCFTRNLLLNVSERSETRLVFGKVKGKSSVAPFSRLSVVKSIKFCINYQKSQNLLCQRNAYFCNKHNVMLQQMSHLPSCSRRHVTQTSTQI